MSSELQKGVFLWQFILGINSPLLPGSPLLQAPGGIGFYVDFLSGDFGENFLLMQSFRKRREEAAIYRFL